MVKEIKTTISRKDLYSKEYNNSKTDENGDDVVVSVKRGLVDILIKISQEAS